MKPTPGKDDGLGYSPLKEEPVRSFFRGALGGALGGTVWIWLPQWILEGRLFMSIVFLALTFYLLPVTLIVGGIVGLYVHRARRDFAQAGVGSSFVYGSSFLVIIGTFIYLIVGASTRNLQLSHLVYVILFGVFVGGFAGLVNGKRSKT